MDTTNITGYTTYGAARGGCGHLHRTPAGARACLAGDQRGCSAQGGYSDRAVVAVGDDGYLYGADMDGIYRADRWIAGPGGPSRGAARFARGVS